MCIYSCHGRAFNWNHCFFVHKHAQIDTKEKMRQSNKFYTECTGLHKKCIQFEKKQIQFYRKKYIKKLVMQ